MIDFMNHDFDIRNIVLACFVPSGTGLSTHKNRPSHGLAIHIGGEKIYTFSDGKELTVKANDIIYLPKHSTYTVTAKGHGDCYAINFDIDESISFSPFVIKAKKHVAIAEHFHLANKIWELKKHGYMMKCKAELYNIIYVIQQEYFSEYFPKNKLEMIQSAVDYIHENYFKENISIEALSKMCNITPEYFRRIFKSFYGVSPINYINNLKITRARELLESQMYSVTDAAIISGYTDMSHFSREFKKRTEISPSEYKKSAQQ
ncbi:MAG: helix-turn-helix domain-containing protein [Clostridia bacterium]|nr:helix-turn-helix domain-containing protein [Clostridia bacterium]